MSKAPNLKQLAVLDWLRRWPDVFLHERGRWTGLWASDEARTHCRCTVYTMSGILPQSTQPGEAVTWGDFDFTPHCGPATFNVLLSQGWLAEVAPDDYRQRQFQISKDGEVALKRYCFRLKGFKPRYAGSRVSRPVKASAALLKRYGGPERARWSLQHHERQAAYHSKIANRLRASLDLYEGSEEQRRDEWLARGKQRRG